jgi:hypothetical protein
LTSTRFVIPPDTTLPCSACHNFDISHGVPASPNEAEP